MDTTVSVDLAQKRYADLGIAVLTHDSLTIRASFLKASELGLTGPPEAEPLARGLTNLCRQLAASILLLDGPQGWKDPGNGLQHARRCEVLLNTPAKTGLPGRVLPGSYTSFVAFSIRVFEALQQHGAGLLLQDQIGSSPSILALESFPLSAWRGIRLPALPAKRKTRPDDIDLYRRILCEQFQIQVEREPTHDELQALVAGLAGVAIQRGDTSGFSVIGDAPRLVDGLWREGFIVNPRR